MRNTTRVIACTVFVLGPIAPAACGDDNASTTTTAPSASSTSGGPTTSATSTTPSSQTSVVAYLVRDEKMAPVRRAGSSDAPGRAAVEALLNGPSSAEGDAGLASVIPAGTRLLGLSIADAVATVDLSSEFGSGGGSLSMQARVAQVVYTLTQFTTTKSVVFHLDGRPVTALGGEGLILDHPQTRADWEAMTPAILVESPLPGDTLSSPFHVKGTANTFEATFMIALVDSAGKKVYEHFATATSGTGTRGTFDESISFSGNAKGAATLKVWESSAKDGSEINVVEIPVVL